MTSFAPELATPSVTNVRTDTLPRLIYEYTDSQSQAVAFITFQTVIVYTIIWFLRIAFLHFLPRDAAMLARFWES